MNILYLCTFAYATIRDENDGDEYKKNYEYFKILTKFFIQLNYQSNNVILLSIIIKSIFQQK